MPLLDKMSCKPQMTGIERLDFRLHAKGLHLRCHLDKHRRAVGHDVVAMPEIHRAAIQRAEFRPAIGDMGEAFGSTHHVGPVGAWWQRRLHTAKHQIAAHAGGQVQDDVGFGIADPRGHLAKQRRIARWLAGFRVADMTMHHGGTGLCGIDGRFGDLRRRDWHLVRLARGVARSGHGAGDEDVAIHRQRHNPVLLRPAGLRPAAS